MRIVIHIGLHKTGTSSFQMACSKQADVLQKYGIHYPVTWEDQSIPYQHADLAHWLESRQMQRISDWMDTELARAQKSDCTQLLLSSERFSTIIGADKGALAEFDTALASRFDAVSYCCVFRSPEPLLSSMLKQELAHGGVSVTHLDEAARGMLAYLFRMAHGIVDHVGDRLVVLSFRELCDSDLGFCNALLAENFDMPPGVIDEKKLNTADNFFGSPFLLMTAMLRGILARTFEVNPYHPRVAEWLEQHLDKGKFQALFRSSSDLDEINSIMSGCLRDVSSACIEKHLIRFQEQYPDLAETEIFGDRAADRTKLLS